MQERAARELSRLDKLIAAAREFAHEVAHEIKDRTVAFAKDIKERAGSLFGNAPQEEQAKAAPGERPGAGAGTTAYPGDAGEAG